MKICHMCGDDFERHELEDDLCGVCFAYNKGEPSPPYEEPEEPEKPSFKNLIAWAKDSQKLDRALDNVLEKIDSGELSIQDLPSIPTSIKLKIVSN